MFCLLQVWCERAVELAEGESPAGVEQSPSAVASTEHTPSRDALPTATPVLPQPAAMVSPIHQGCAA